MKSFYFGLLTYGLSLSAYAAGSADADNKVGIASFYGDEFEGSLTANGEKFAQNQMTCAHLSLPLGTWVKVTNLKNHKWVILKVNDRGPYIDGRMVDLSRHAAEVLGFTHEGLAQVRLEVLKPTAVHSFSRKNMVARNPAVYKYLHPGRKGGKAMASNKAGFIHKTSSIPVSGKQKLHNAAPDDCRLQRKDKENYLIFFGIFYRPEKISAFHEEIKPVISEIEPVRFFEEHRAVSWIAP